MDNTTVSLLKIIETLQKQEAKKDEQLEKMQQTIDKLSSQIAWFQRKMFGRSSEKYGALNMGPTLFDNIDELPQQPEDVQVPPEIQNPPAAKKRTRKAPRKDILEGLPILERTIEPEGIDTSLYKCIGKEVTKVVEYEPGKLYVVATIRPKYILKTASESDNKTEVVIAPMPLYPIYKSVAGSSLLSELLVGKYSYHLPFYRQIQQFKDLGIKLTSSTINDWFIGSCNLLKPLYDRIKHDILSTEYIQVDETVLPVINKEKKQAAKEYLWLVRSNEKRAVFFDYVDGSRSANTAQQVIGSFKGYLQSDGYSAYDSFLKNIEIRLVACWAHVRRKYTESIDENKALAEYALSQIQLLYNVERHIQENNLSPNEILQKRREISLPIINKIKSWIEENYSSVLPGSRIGKAMSYNYTLMNRLTAYVDNSSLLIDNNRAENAVRPIAVCRKNTLFCGNHNAANNAAIIFTIIGCCKEHKINVREYLNDILLQLPYLVSSSSSDLTKLLPWEWIKSHPESSLKESE